MSVEVDVCPLDDDDAETLADRLDGAVGELSSFHLTHGFYVQGVGRRTAILPPGWVGRLVEVASAATNGRVGLCLEPHDLCVAKLLANREKDHVFVDALILAELVDPNVLWERVVVTSTAAERVDAATGFLRAHCDRWSALGLVVRAAR
jgi:hypothetical protein